MLRETDIWGCLDLHHGFIRYPVLRVARAIAQCKWEGNNHYDYHNFAANVDTIVMHQFFMSTKAKLGDNRAFTKISFAYCSLNDFSIFVPRNSLTELSKMF